MPRPSREADRRLHAALVAGRAAARLRPVVTAAPDEALMSISVGGTEARVPAAALLAFLEVLDDLADGRDVVVAPADLQVGTAEAARVLGVSRPWVAELIDRGELPSARHGSKRRVALGPLVTHRRRMAAARREAAAKVSDVLGTTTASRSDHVAATPWGD